MLPATAAVVHHRVRNSLQLVQTLLTLQATLTPNASVAEQLHAAANRVATVATIHDRLYGEDSAKDNNTAHYLERLVEDFRKFAPDRNIQIFRQADIPSAKA
jgi:two-component sensor histidine kinase